MFTDFLTGSQQQVLHLAVHSIALIDGKVQRPEGELLDAINREGGYLLEMDLQDNPLPPAEIAAQITDVFREDSAGSSSRRAFVGAMAAMVTVDGDQDSEELDLLKLFMDAVGVQSSEADEFLAFGQRIRELNRDGANLVGNK